MKSMVLIGMGVLALGSLVVYGLNVTKLSSASSSAAVLTGTPAGENGASAELEALRKDVRRIERVTGALAGEQSKAGGPATPPTPEQMADRAAEVERDAAERRRFTAQRFAFLESHFSGERSDPSRTTELRGQIDAILADDRFKLLGLKKLDCKATMCRVEFKLSDSPEQGRMLVPALLSGVKGVSGGTMQTTDAPTDVAVAFLSREGHEFPSPEGWK